jgi:phasin family protein
MFSNTQQFSNATKALFDNQFASLSALSGNVVESVEKVVALNMAAAKATSEESTAAMKQLLTAKDPQEFFTLVTAQAKLNAEKLQSYNRTLAEIAANSKAELSKVVEAQVSESREKVAGSGDVEIGHRQRQCRLRAIEQERQASRRGGGRKCCQGNRAVFPERGKNERPIREEVIIR